MQNSKFSYLRPVSRVILAAGHGGSDPGSTHNGQTERDQNIFMADTIANLLRARGIEVVVVPHSLGLRDSISWINNRYKWGEGWSIEIHRDSASGLTFEDASKRLGVYGYGRFTGKDGKVYEEDARSMSIARACRDTFLRLGANNKTWARPDHVARYGRLGWIRDIKTLSHLFELAFIQGNSSQDHLKWLSTLAAIAIYEPLTGESWGTTSNNNSNNNSNNMPSFDESAQKAQNNPAIWNDPSITPEIKKYVTTDKDIEKILQSIIDVSNQRDDYRIQLAQCEINLEQERNSGSGGGVTNHLLERANQVGYNLDSLPADISQAVRNNDINYLLETLKRLNNEKNSLAQQLSEKNIELASLKIQLERIQKQVANLNSSTKPFWQSKKWLADIAAKSASVGLIAFQTAQIQEGDDWQTIGVKLGSAVATALGISYMSSAYVKGQSEIDTANIKRLPNAEF